MRREEEARLKGEVKKKGGGGEGTVCVLVPDCLLVSGQRDKI